MEKISKNKKRPRKPRKKSENILEFPAEKIAALPGPTVADDQQLIIDACRHTIRVCMESSGGMTVAACQAAKILAESLQARAMLEEKTIEVVFDPIAVDEAEGAKA